MAKKQKKKHNKVFIILFAVLFATLLLTISYAAFSDQLTITDIVGHVRVDKVVRINRVTTASGAVTNLEFDSNSVLNTVSIPAGESVTYNVVVTNLGNVPVAVSNVSFSNGNTQVSGLSANISPNNYVKICDNNVCTGGVSKTVSVTITNTTGSTINTELDAELTFSEVYDINYEGNKIGEAIDGANFSYTFSSNPPVRLVKTSGTCDSFNYANNTLTITNVSSDLSFINAFVVTYNNESIGTVAQGGTFTKNMEPNFPATVTKDSGTATFTYQNHIITLTNVQSDVALSGVVGTVEITRIDHVAGSDKNVLSSTPPTYSGMDASFSVVFQRPEGSTSTEFETMYEVDITNTYYDDYIFRGLDFNPQITASAGSDTAELELIPIGISNGETIASETTKTFRVKLVLTPTNPDGNYSTDTNTQVDTTPDNEEETGTISASINTTTGDLRSPNTLAPFTVTVTSTYPSDKEFNLISSNSNLEIVDINGNSLSNMTIHGESTEQYQVYVKIGQGATFVSNSTTMNMYLSIDGMANILVDTLTLSVDKYDVPDTTKVTVSNLQLSYYYDKANQRPTIKATWNRDDVGGTAISDYVVTAYRSNNQVAETCHTNSATRECLFTTLSENTAYYAIVYGIDSAQPANSGASDVGGANTNPGYATRSPGNSTFKWSYTVNTTNPSNNNLTVGGDGSTAILGASHTITLTATGSSGYEAPSSPTVTMDNAGSDFYTYSRSSNSRVGTIIIGEVTGNITVRGSREGSCLIAGTKVLMADGSYKNIENINYDDLLAVWNYDTGSITYTYPAFIENDTTVYSYTKTTFDDGTTIGTYDSHGIFSYDLNRFILTTDIDNYKVGAKFVKIENGKVKIVTIKKIETIHEMVRVYHIVSNGYFNLIANDILTTEPNIMISNQYGFTGNVMWPKGTREKIINNPDNLYSYDLFSDIMPYYMFKALRVDEGKYVVDQGMISFDLLKLYLASRPANNEYFRDLPKNSNGKRLITITTSLDNVTLYNKYNYVYEEGTYYHLPNRYNIKCYLNTINNTCYQKGSNVKVDVSTHFIAVYK